MSTPIEFATWVEHVLVAPAVRDSVDSDRDLYLEERVIRDAQRATGKVPYPTTATVTWTHQEEIGLPGDDDWQPEMWMARLSVLVDV